MPCLCCGSNATFEECQCVGSGGRWVQWYLWDPDQCALGTVYYPETYNQADVLRCERNPLVCDATTNNHYI